VPPSDLGHETYTGARLSRLNFELVAAVQYGSRPRMQRATRNTQVHAYAAECVKRGLSPRCLVVGVI